MRYHLTLVRMAIIKKSKKVNVGEGVEKRECPYTVGGNIIGTTSMKKVWRFIKR